MWHLLTITQRSEIVTTFICRVNSGAVGSLFFKQQLAKAEDGDASAQRFVANAYFEGLYAARNYDEAAKWYRKAAGNGDFYSQSALVRLYREGLGVKQDGVEAEKWERIANDNSREITLSDGRKGRAPKADESSQKAVENSSFEHLMTKDEQLQAGLNKLSSSEREKLKELLMRTVQQAQAAVKGTPQTGQSSSAAEKNGVQPLPAHLPPLPSDLLSTGRALVANAQPPKAITLGKHWIASTTVIHHEIVMPPFGSQRSGYLNTIADGIVLTFEDGSKLEVAAAPLGKDNIWKQLSSALSKVSEVILDRSDSPSYPYMLRNQNFRQPLMIQVPSHGEAPIYLVEARK